MPTEKAHGIQIMKMCEAFASNGHEVVLVVPNRETSVNEDPFVYYNVRPNFSIRKLSTIDLTGYGKWGFRVQSITYSIAVLFLMRSLSRENMVIYSRDELPLFLLSFGNRKLMWETHMGHMNIFIRRLIKEKVSIVAITNGLKDFYIKHGASSNLIHIAPDGVDLKEFHENYSQTESRKILGLPTDKKIVMYIGLFDEWKGYKTLLEASKSLAYNSNILFVLIGKGKDMDSLKSQYPEAIFLGYRPYNELPINQKAADVLVIPNSGKTKISSHYTSPIKLFAHMASGVPIVASDLPSLREIIDDTTAYLFEPDNAKSLEQAILGAIVDSEGSEKKALNAKDRSIQYSWIERARGILEFITLV